MDYQHAFDIAFMLLAAIGGFVMRTLHAVVETQRKELSEFKQYVALNHPTHDGINRRFDKVDDNINRLGDKIDDNMKTVVSKIDSVLDREHNRRRQDDE